MLKYLESHSWFLLLEHQLRNHLMIECVLEHHLGVQVLQFSQLPAPLRKPMRYWDIGNIYSNHRLT